MCRKTYFCVGGVRRRIKHVLNCRGIWSDNALIVDKLCLLPFSPSLIFVVIETDCFDEGG